MYVYLIFKHFVNDCSYQAVKVIKHLIKHIFTYLTLGAPHDLPDIELNGRKRGSCIRVLCKA